MLCPFIPGKLLPWRMSAEAAALMIALWRLDCTCIPDFSLGLCISADSSWGQRPQITCKEIKQQAWSMNVMCWEWHMVYKEYHSVAHLKIELKRDARNFCQADCGPEFVCPIWVRRDSKWHFLMVELLR